MPRVGLGNIELTGEDVTIPIGDVSIPAMIYRPTGRQAAPAVILCPGGTGTGMHEIVEWLASALRDAGIVALTIGWRASVPDRDPDDIAAAIDWLETLPEVDATRVGAYGMSRGGNAALRAAAIEPRLKVIATCGAFTELLEQLKGLALYAPARRDMIVEWLGDPVERRDYYLSIEARTYGERIRQPALLVHGEHDMHSPPEQSIAMKDAIERGGNTDVSLVLVPMMGHYGEVVPNGYGFDMLVNLIVPFYQTKL